MTKINQIKGIFLVFFCLLLISSCKKGSSPTSGGGGNNNPPPPPGEQFYFTFKADGIAKNFKGLNVAKDDTMNFQTMYLIATLSPSTLNPIFTFTLQNQGSWVNGISYKLDNSDRASHCEYQNESLFIFKSSASSATPTEGLTITFDKLNPAKFGIVTGTFSGNLQLEENTNTVDITEGKFRMQFLN